MNRQIPRRVLTGLAAAAPLILSGCATIKPAPPIVIHVPFDGAQATEMLGAGPNTVTGSALIRQQGGGVVTCAGLAISLFPATGYASARMQAIYGNIERGFRPALMPILTFDPSPEEYLRTARFLTCDAQGRFSFDNVRDGTYYVVTNIQWKVGYSTQGGAIMQRVSVKGGERHDIVVAP